MVCSRSLLKNYFFISAKGAAAKLKNCHRGAGEIEKQHDYILS